MGRTGQTEQEGLLWKLSSIPPGVTIPLHSHPDTEDLLVISVDYLIDRLSYLRPDAFDFL
jgi:hypothetical protein